MRTIAVLLLTAALACMDSSRPSRTPPVDAIAKAADTTVDLSQLALSGPVQFVLGDSALSAPVELPLEAFDASGHAVMRIAGLAHVLRSEVAVARNDSVAPMGRGVTLVMAWAGGKHAATGVHVYQRVDAASLLPDNLSRDSVRDTAFRNP